MKRLLFVVLLFIHSAASATHIVGGEFEFLFKHIDTQGRFHYRLALILYFDEINGNVGARDTQMFVRIFRKSNNSVAMDSLLLRVSTTTDVGYYKPECSSGNAIVTDRIYYVYSPNGVPEDLVLDPEEFAQPQGYYISWERCCRNYGIKNIYSEDPLNGNGKYAGQTFYMEFPSLIKNGQPFTNSSPNLFPPLSDYACPGRFYWVDFKGTDADGDSLVYSTITPINTHTEDAIPPNLVPRPGPYPNVLWQPGFGINDIVHGNPDLHISSDGLLTVTPALPGLFVFSIRCEEYRDGIKIGEVRRDFQLLVLTNCPPATKPVVEGKRRDQAQYSADNLAVAFSNQVTDENRCIDIRVTDPDAASRNEKIKIKALAVNFKDNVDEVLPEISTDILSGDGDAAAFSVCFPECPFLIGTYLIDIIVEDDSCPLPLTDTITVAVDVQPPPNDSPLFDKELIQATANEGSGFPVWTFTGTDTDFDDLNIILPDEEDFNLEDFGFDFSVTQESAGQIKAQLTWDTRCDVIDFSKQTEFKFKFELDDQDKCEITPSDTLTFDLTMNLYDFHHPQITYLPEPGNKEITLDQHVFDNITFEVKGSDADSETITLHGAGKDFNMADFGATFPTISFVNEGTSVFNWPLTCDNVNPTVKDKFEFMFEVVDNNNRCGYYLADTLWVTVNVDPPVNTAPEIFVDNKANDFDVAYTLGDEIRLPLLGTDADLPAPDLLTLELINAEGTVEPQGYSFTSTPANGTVNGLFLWKPACEIFRGNDYENDYVFTFRVKDQRCYTTSMEDEITVNVNIKDVDAAIDDFLPPNVITPNGDGKNDFFAMLKEDPDTRELINILPKDNCDGIFKSIYIYNRWGREVFYSTDRDFRWYANSDPTGVYFYQLLYSNHEYKGIITIAGESQHNR
jgi:hypothetical protein